MNFSTFFSKQARRPGGLFGRRVMSLVFDKGSAFLNDFVSELMSVQADDRIIEIGFGTGKLIYIYSKDDVQNLLIDAGFSNNVSIVSRSKGNSIFH